jgi:hypothetical protein
MIKLLSGLVLAIFTAGAVAAPEPQCGEYEKFRSQRDSALRTSNLAQYCNALSGLIRLLPPSPPDSARLKCEAKATNGNVEAWLKIRPNVIAASKATFDQQCK